MIVSLLYRATRALLSVPAFLLRRDTAIEAEMLVLRHENAVLRRQLNGLIRYESADRFWLAALSSLLPRHRWCSVFPVVPGTLLAWHRGLVAARWNYTARRRRTGRPLTVAGPKKLTLRLAREKLIIELVGAEQLIPSQRAPRPSVPPPRTILPGQSTLVASGVQRHLPDHAVQVSDDRDPQNIVRYWHSVNHTRA